MIIAGANLGATSSGKPLRDGGAAIVVDGKLTYALAEERVTRRKAAGGFSKSLELGLASVGAKDFDALYLSSCCQPLQGSHDPKVRFVDHHKSHAALSYFASPFREAVVCVADAGGDVLSQGETTSEWWNHRRQQLSVYFAKDGHFEIVDRQFDLPNMCGLGEMFRAFTHYLGWPSGRHAGKTMALSAYGMSEVSNSDSLFVWEEGKLRTRLTRFDPNRPHETARDLLQSIDRDDLVKDWDQNGSERARATIAAIAQYSLEYALREVTLHWRDNTNCNNLCLSGGVALNCTATMKLREQGFDLFIPPGAGDNGQSVGNAILGHLDRVGEPPNLGEFPYLGPKYENTFGEIRTKMSALGVKGKLSYHSSRADLSNYVARQLFDGEIVFWHQGASEFGARALGNRSILANPLYADVVPRLNRLKNREDFNPFAASCILNDAHELFVDAQQSQFMTLAFKRKPEPVANSLRAVLHRDDSCRAHVLDRKHNPKYFDLLSDFGKLSGVGALLNTSLNGPGEPIAESLEDTMKLFGKSDISSVLVVDDFVIEKSHSAR